MEALIPNEEKKKVEHAKKLLNDFNIYEGEKILKDLVKQHPYESYYHEALVQIQRQVLRNITVASSEIEKIKLSNPIVDSTDAGFDNFEKIDTTKKTKSIAQLSDYGLDRNQNIEITKSIKKPKRDVENIGLNEAIVTIDSSLLVDETNDEKENKPTKKDKEIKKSLKNLESLAAIPYESYKYDFILNCRKATRVLNTVDSASFYLREFLVDSIDVDLKATDLALEEYETGLEEYYSKNIPAATKHFEKAIELYPNFYKAHLFLGDAYYLLNKDTDAVRMFHQASLIEPELPNAYEKLALFFYDRGKYTEAASQIIEAILVYPQDHYFSFLKRVVNKAGNDFDLQWIRRDVFPLTTKQNFEEIIADEKTPWWHYQSIKQDVYGYYDTAGFVRPNDKTTERYLEMYGWKKMLNNTGKQYFPFARAMQKMGYLECYIFITLFHNDIYAQYKDYVKNNPDKVRKYFNLLINWQDKKFDKIRKEFFDIKETKKENKKEK